MGNHENGTPGASSLPMTMARFSDLLDIYGGDLSRWPPDEAAAARRLLTESVTARSALEDARRLDELLDTATVQPPSPGLVDRIMAAAPKAQPEQRGATGPSRGPTGWLGRMAEAMFATGWPAWQPGVAVAGALALGLIAGYAGLPAMESATFDADGVDWLALGLLESEETAS